MSEPPPPTKRQDESTISFDIFNYPPPLQQQILRKMHPEELFQFWLTGKKARNLIQEIKMEKNEQEIHIDFCNPYDISIVIERDDRSLHFVADMDKERDSEDGECVGQINLDGCDWFQKSSNGNRSPYLGSWSYFVFVADHKKFDVVRTATMLKTIFNTELVSMTFAMDVLSMRCSFELCGELDFTESLARILQGRFPSTGRVSREKKIDLLVALLKSPETNGINIYYGEQNKKIHIERHLNFVLKLWTQHAVPGRNRDLICVCFENVTRTPMKNVFKNMNLITDTVVSNETDPSRRETVFRSRTGVLATCTLTCSRMKLRISE